MQELVHAHELANHSCNFIHLKKK